MIKQIFRNIIISWLNIIGIAIGFTCFILVALWVFNEKSYDSFNEEADHIFRISRHETSSDGRVSNAATTPSPLGPELKQKIPEITSFTRFYRIENFIGEVQAVYMDKRFFEKEFCFADPEFFSIFTYKFIKGNKNDALGDPNSVVITENTAARYFGSENPLGKMIQVTGLGEYMVTGVIENIRPDSHIMFDFISPIQPLLSRYEWMTRWNIPHFYTYITLAENILPADIIVKTDDLINGIGDKSLSALNTVFRYQPLQDIHLVSELDHELEGNGRGILKTIRIFMVFASFVLLISCLNFMIIYIARSFENKAEIGIRKTFGADRFSIIKMFYIIITVLLIIGFLIGILLVLSFIPFFNSFIGLEIEINTLGSFKLLIILGLVILISSLISGLYPAFYISSFNPSQIIQGSMNYPARRGGRIKLFVITQYILSMFFIIGSVIYFAQHRFMINKDLGYSYENVYCVRNNKEIRDHFDAFKNTLKDNPAIANISYCSNLPMETTNRTIIKNWEGAGEEDQALMAYIYVDKDYIETMSITIVEGRDFEFESDMTEGFIINKEAKKQMGLEETIGKKFSLNGVDGRIIGVIEDINLGSLASGLEPLILKVSNNYSKFVLLKINGEDSEGTLNYIETRFSEFSSTYHFEAWPLKWSIVNLYNDHQKASRLILLFSILGVIIASFGLYGLIEYSLKLRIKEIGIRKVMGAMPFTIINIFLKDYGLMILIASIISWIAAFLYFNNWLESFAFRIPLRLWYFLAASLISMIITSLIIFLKTYYTAVTEPARLIRSE